MKKREKGGQGIYRTESYRAVSIRLDWSREGGIIGEERRKRKSRVVYRNKG